MKMNRALLGFGSVMALAAAAYAQPTADVNVGTLTNVPATGAVTGISATARVKWVKFTIPLGGVDRTLGSYLDIDTNGGTLTGGDSMIGLYTSAGAFVASDDDSGPSSYSMISFGVASPTRAGLAATGNATAAGASHAGSKGATLAAGDYWLAISGYSTSFGTTAWGVTTTHTRTGDVAYRIAYFNPNAPFNPTGTGTWSPAAMTTCASANVLATVTVVPGGNPTSTDLSVKADLSSVGGPSNTRMYDDGTNGDVTAGDRIYSFALTVPAGQSAGNKTFSYAIDDGQGRSATGTSGNLVISNCPMANNTCEAAETINIGDNKAGYLVSTGVTSTVPSCTLTSGNMNWYKFDGTGNTMTVSTCNAGSNFDTIVGVFCGIDGCGALTCIGGNDDDSACTAVSTLRSTFSFCSVQGARYFVAVRGYSTNLGNYNLTLTDSGQPCTATIACGQPTPPSGVGSYTGSGQNCGDTATLLRVTVTNGSFPASTGVTVTADASALGGSATLSLNDAGTNGDVTAGDGIFSANVNIAYTTAAGVANVPFTCADAQGRSSTGSFGVTVANCTAVGACCVPSSASCQILTRAACVAAGGNYSGTGTLCSSPDGYGTPYASGDTFPIAIPDYSTIPGSASTSVTVAGSTAGTDYMRISVGLTHTYPGDLIGTLSNGTHSAALFSRQGASADVGGVYVFGTDGTVTFAGGSPVGVYSTFNPLSNFAGDFADGTWTLTVTDNAGIDVGTIDSFSIAFSNSHPTCNFCPPCAADFNQDGGVDGADVSDFFPAWESASSCADVNQDGGIDGSDIDTFFQVWQAGGC